MQRASTAVVDEDFGGLVVNTSEISKGAEAAVAAQAPVVPESGETNAGEKFAEVMKRVLGGPGLQAVLGEVANMGVIRVDAAPTNVEEPQDGAPEEGEIEAHGAPVQEESDLEEEEETEAKDVSAEEREATDEVVAEVPEAVAVEAPAAVVVEAPEAVVIEAVQQAGKTIEGEEAVTQEAAVAGAVVLGKELPGFKLQKTDQVGAEAVAQTVKEADTQQSAAQSPEQLGGTQSVKDASAKSSAGQQNVKPAAEVYGALERAIENAAEGSESGPGLGEPQQTPPPVDVKAAPKEKSAEVILTEATLSQGMMARLSEGSSAGEQGIVRSARNGAVEAAGMSTQGNAEKIAAAKSKAASGLPAKDQAKVVEQVKELLQKAIQNRDSNTITVRVNPPELGMMTVKVTQRESQLYARIIPESQEVEQVLRNKVAEVTNVLSAAGLKPDQVHVSIGRERTDAEAFQFQQFMSRSDSGQRQESGERQGARKEQSMSGTSMRNSEELVADLGWVA